MGKVLRISEKDICGKPGCDRLVMVIFLYNEGGVNACIDHAKETMDEYIEYIKEEEV